LTSTSKTGGIERVTRAQAASRAGLSPAVAPTASTQSTTQVANFDTSMASVHSLREQTKLREPNLPPPNTRLIFVWGWWQLGQLCAAGTAGSF
jgi:hypothetical protein